MGEKKTHQMTGKRQKHVLFTTVTSNFGSECCVCSKHGQEITKLGSFATQVQSEVLLGVFVPVVDDSISCCAICVFKSVKTLLLLALTEEQKAASSGTF